MFSACMSFTVRMVVVVAFCIGIIIELAAYIGNYCLIGTTLHPTEKLDSCFIQSILCTTTDAATDKHLDT